MKERLIGNEQYDYYDYMMVYQALRRVLRVYRGYSHFFVDDTDVTTLETPWSMRLDGL